MNLAAGTRLRDRYRLRRRLGGGGSAETWLVEDESTGRACVLKLLELAGSEGWRAVELFEREARVLRNLDHPDIPRFFDFFREQDEAGARIGLLCEHIAGHSLGELAGVRRFSPAEAARIGVEIAGVLEYLHGLSPPVIHRDIKPPNIILEAGGRAHLIDFGAVRDILRPAHETAPGGDTIVGTYGYMPREQFAGHAVPASDVYALGATLVHLLAGVPPWKLRQDDGRLDLSRTRAPRALVELLARATEPDPAVRIASASELRAGLEPFRAAPARVPARVPRRFTLRSLRAPLAAVGLLATALYWFGRYAPPQGPQPAAESIDDHGGCGRWPAPAPGINLVANPGLDGPCGWVFRPSAGKLLDGGARAAVVRAGQEVWQRIDVRAMAETIRTGTCTVTFRARLKSTGASGAGGRPYLRGMAMREAESEWEHLSGFEPSTSSEWTTREHTWELPSGTKLIQIELAASAVAGSLNRGQAWFDDIEVVLTCRAVLGPPG